MKFLLPIVLAFLFTTTGSAYAEDLSIKPGMWRTTTTSTNTLMPEPAVTTNDICVEGNVFNPEDMVRDMEDCQLITSSVRSNTMDFELACIMEGGSAKVTGQYAVDGDDGQGQMGMHMKIGPMIMEADVQWESTYLGACE